MATPKVLWSISNISEMSGNIVTYPTNHLLGLAQELRNKIYDHVIVEIQNSRRAWNQQSHTEYDSLLLVCKQLYLETAQHVFLYRATRFGLPKILGLTPNKTNVNMLRTLNLQVSHQVDHRTFQCILTVLDKFQLSIQELHLSFYGEDLHGNGLVANGCGHSPKLHNQDVALLPSGQNIDVAFAFLRQIINLRNLRILHIENLNLPVLSSVLLQNKRYLQAVCLVTDPRAQVPDLKKIYRKRPDLFKGMLGGAPTKPPVRVLELDANTAVPAEALLNTLMPDLQHFSWRVPSYDLQPERRTYESSFEHITCKTLGNLSVKAPDLKTLRLCVTRRAPNPHHSSFSWEISNINHALATYLPSFMSLEHLEIHDSYADRFYLDTLIDSLPYGLRRLYISERLINVDDLVKNVRGKYVLCHTGENFGFDFAFGDSDTGECEEDDPSGIVYMSISQHGHVEFHNTHQIEGPTDNKMTIQRHLSRSNDYLADKMMLGEARSRDDEILLGTGKLGFIGFDYDISADECHNVKFGTSESVRTKIFRLNGQLLDREHNLHLVSSQNIGRSPGIGIQPNRKRSLRESSHNSETDVYSKHPEIHQALHHMAQLKWHNHHIIELTADLEDCLDDTMSWYFGTENDAEEVFRTELAAPVKDQRQKPFLIESDHNPSGRCQWSAPEYVVPPVGSFPAPVVPRDWRDNIKEST